MQHGIDYGFKIRLMLLDIALGILQVQQIVLLGQLVVIRLPRYYLLEIQLSGFKLMVQVLMGHGVLVNHLRLIHQQV